MQKVLLYPTDRKQRAQTVYAELLFSQHRVQQLHAIITSVLAHNPQTMYSQMSSNNNKQRTK